MQMYLVRRMGRHAASCSCKDTAAFGILRSGCTFLTYTLRETTVFARFVMLAVCNSSIKHDTSIRIQFGGLTAWLFFWFLRGASALLTLLKAAACAVHPALAPAEPKDLWRFWGQHTDHVAVVSTAHDDQGV